jgi:hypothetical protein
MTLAAISDLRRTPHLAQLPGFTASVAAVAETILTSAPQSATKPSPLTLSES